MLTSWVEGRRNGGLENVAWSGREVIVVVDRLRVAQDLPRSERVQEDFRGW